MTWLDEIETYLEDLPLDGATLYDLLYMVRVIREFAEHIKDVKRWGGHVAITYLIDDAADNDPVLRELCDKAANSWENVSPDAKEVSDG